MPTRHDTVSPGARKQSGVARSDGSERATSPLVSVIPAVRRGPLSFRCRSAAVALRPVPSAPNVYHLELRQFPHMTRAFNLDREALDVRFLRPFVAGELIEYDDRKWAPERTRLTVLEGPELSQVDRGLGRGWGLATKQGEDVTEQVVAEIHRGAEARPEVELLKDAIAEVARNRITFGDVVALAAAKQPLWRASEQLSLAEQAVWEMLHQGRLQMTEDDDAVARERWQPLVLRWSTWAGTTGDAITLRAL
jgi:hypothetical protein